MKIELNSIKNELEERGIVVLESYTPSSVLEKLNLEFDKLTSKDHTGAPLTPYSEGKCARIVRSEFDKEQFSATETFFSNSNFKELAENYLGEEVDLNTEIFVVKDVVGSKHIANDLHYDVIKTFKFFLYLTDTTKENGAFTCVPSSHKRTSEYRKEKGKEISFDNRYLSRELDVQDFAPEIPIEGKAGTLIIFDTDTWHRGGIVSSGERRVMRGHTRPMEHKQIPLNKTAIKTPTETPSIFRRIINKIKS